MQGRRKKQLAVYRGYFKNDKKHSKKATQSHPDGTKYSGTYIDNKQHGKGIKTWKNGDSYNGEFFEDLR